MRIVEQRRRVRGRARRGRLPCPARCCRCGRRGRARARRRAWRGTARTTATSGVPDSCATSYAACIVRRIEKLVPPPRSVARPTRTGRSGRFAVPSLKRPLPRKLFDVGQCASAVPRLVQEREVGFGRDACRGRRSCAGRSGRGARRRRDTTRASREHRRRPARPRRGSPTRATARSTSGCSRLSAPAASQLRGRGRRRRSAA